jgi:sulfur carrier protein ThiS
MSSLPLYLADLVAIGVLTFAVFFPRHRRRDLIVAYLGVNVGVLAVSAALSSSSVGAGLGLGLFGVLSIIRLRSTELDQPEVAYYFSALALGLLGGLGTADSVLPFVLMALILAAMFVAGHPMLLRRYRQQVVLLDSAFTDEGALIAHLEGMLGARVHQVNVQRVDLVNDTTLTDVRFELGKRPRAAAVVLDDNAVPGASLNGHVRRSAQVQA